MARHVPQEQTILILCLTPDCIELAKSPYAKNRKNNILDYTNDLLICSSVFREAYLLEESSSFQILEQMKNIEQF